MSNIIDKIQVSGVTYTLSAETGGGGNATVELTQAEYDALVSAGTVSADTYYIITDAYSPDISSITSAVTSGSTDSEIPTAKAVYDAIPTGSSSFDLPIYSGTGTNALVFNNSGNTASGNFSHAEGNNTTSSGISSHAEGNNTYALGHYSHAEGLYTDTKNQSEHASGRHNVSSSASTTFGDSGNTLFTVGNGVNIHKHNVLDIRQNGDIYIADSNAIVAGSTTSGETYNTVPMIKLQDKFANIDTTIGDINTILSSI